MDEAVDASDPRLGGVRPSQLPTSQAQRMSAVDGAAMVLFENVFPATPSGKVELVSDVLAKRWGAAARIADWRGRKRHCR